MKSKSLWMEGISTREEPILTENISCDVLIIGAGITGVSTAYHLRNYNLNVVVVDKNKIGYGVSARTTGKLTYLQETIYSELSEKKSKEIAKLYLKSQQEIISRVVQIIEENNIDCNLKKVSSYVFTNREKETLKKEEEILKEFGVPIEFGNKNEYDYLKVDDTYVFHPLKYILSLKEIAKKAGIHFYEHTEIQFLKKEGDLFVCGNEQVQIRACKVVFACHYPYFIFPFLIPMKCTLEKSYIAASNVDKIEPYSAISSGKPVLSLRFHQDNNTSYRLLLAESHFLYKDQNSVLHFENLKKINSDLSGTLQFLWSNHDIITYDHLPFIGHFEKRNQNLFLATGFNTWGMTNGSLSGKIIADMIQNIFNPYQELFSPLRSLDIEKVPHSMYASVKPMIESKLWKNKDWYPASVSFEKRNGKNVAIYVDNHGKEHIVYNLCPHFKCSLLFNPVEKTWDCPCHGSRFSLDGDVIIGPSTESIRYPK